MNGNKKQELKRALGGTKTMNTAFKEKLECGDLDKPIPVSQAKSKFLEYYRLASRGFEVITQKKNTDDTVSILSTSTISAMLDALPFHTEVTNDKGYDNPYTIAVKEVPLYGSGDTKESAIGNLIDATVEFMDIYKERMDIYNKVYSALQKVYVFKLIRCGNDRDAIRNAYGL